MYRFFFLFILHFFIAAQANSSTQDYSFKFIESNLINAPKNMIAKPKEVITKYQWLQVKNIPDNYKKLFQIPNNINNDSVALLVNSYFTIKRSAEKFDKNFYRNISILSELSGMNYMKTQQLDKYNLQFSPTFFKSINAKATILFPTLTTQYKNLPKVDPNSFIVHLKSYNFSSDLLQSDIISVFNKKGNETEINNISFAITTDKSINSLYMKIKRNIMLKKLNEQSKKMLNIFVS